MKKKAEHSKVDRLRLRRAKNRLEPANINQKSTRIQPKRRELIEEALDQEFQEELIDLDDIDPDHEDYLDEPELSNDD